jgi:hypothetical protein
MLHWYVMELYVPFFAWGRLNSGVPTYWGHLFVNGKAAQKEGLGPTQRSRVNVKHDHITSYYPWHGWWALEDAEDFSNSILSKLTEEEMGYDAQVVLRLLFCWFPEPFSSSSTKEFTQKTAGEEFANAWHSGFSDTGFGQTDPYLAARTWPFSSAVLKSLLVDIAVVPWSLYQLQNWIGRTRQISINFLLTFWFEKDFIVFTFPRNE